MAFDLFVIVAVAAGLITGGWKGMAWQLAGIASVVLGFVLGRPLSSMVSAQLDEPNMFTRFLVFGVCYALISLVCYLVALAMRKKLEKEEMKRLDRHIGAFLGAVHGMAVCAVITMFLIRSSALWIVPRLQAGSSQSEPRHAGHAGAAFRRLPMPEVSRGAVRRRRW